MRKLLPLAFLLVMFVGLMACQPELHEEPAAQVADQMKFHFYWEDGTESAILISMPQRKWNTQLAEVIWESVYSRPFMFFVSGSKVTFELNMPEPGNSIVMRVVAYWDDRAKGLIGRVVKYVYEEDGVDITGHVAGFPF